MERDVRAKRGGDAVGLAQIGPPGKGKPGEEEDMERDIRAKRGVGLAEVGPPGEEEETEEQKKERLAKENDALKSIYDGYITKLEAPELRRTRKPGHPPSSKEARADLNAIKAATWLRTKADTKAEDLTPEAIDAMIKALDCNNNDLFEVLATTLGMIAKKTKLSKNVSPDKVKKDVGDALVAEAQKSYDDDERAGLAGKALVPFLKISPEVTKKLLEPLGNVDLNKYIKGVVVAAYSMDFVDKQLFEGCASRMSADKADVRSDAVRAMGKLFEDLPEKSLESLAPDVTKAVSVLVGHLKSEDDEGIRRDTIKSFNTLIKQQPKSLQDVRDGMGKLVGELEAEKDAKVRQQIFSSLIELGKGVPDSLEETTVSKMATKVGTEERNLVEGIAYAIDAGPVPTALQEAVAKNLVGSLDKADSYGKQKIFQALLKVPVALSAEATISPLKQLLDERLASDVGIRRMWAASSYGDLAVALGTSFFQDIRSKLDDKLLAEKDDPVKRKILQAISKIAKAARAAEKAKEEAANKGKEEAANKEGATAAKEQAPKNGYE